jgi:hypothetical protein
MYAGVVPRTVPETVRSVADAESAVHRKQAAARIDVRRVGIRLRMQSMVVEAFRR